MAFMPWSDRFITGLAQIDEQHHWLVDQTNRLYDEITHESPDPAAIHQILEGLVEYTFNHFIVEEELFARHAYPENEAHKAEHDRFTKLAAEVLLKHEGGDNVSREILEFLKEWLKHHILEVDMAYVPFLKAHDEAS